MSDVFISYSRRDQEFVRRLWQALHDRDRQAWVDWEGIAPSAEWMAEIRSAIDAADAFVVVVSPSSMTSNVCRQEIDHAAAAGKRVVPIVLAEPDGQTVPEAVAARNWIFFREGDDFDAAFDQLLKAVDTDLSWVHEHTRLLVRAQEWDAAGRERSGVLRGRELDAAERWLAAATTHAEAQLTQSQTEYILSSRQSASRGQRNRLTAATAGLVVALALALFALVSRSQAIRQRHIAEAETRTATSRELAATAESQIGTDPELSLLLAIQAAKVEPSVQAIQALRDGLGASLVRVRIPLQAGESAILAFSGDGKRLVGAASGGVVHVWDTSTGRQLAQMGDRTGSSIGVASNRDGTVVAIGLQDGTAEVWDVASGSRLVQLTGLGRLNGVALTADGTELATASGDGVATIWKVAGGTALLTLQGHDGPVARVAFSPDGGQAVTAADSGMVRTWDLVGRRSLLALAGPASPGTVAYTADGGRVEAASVLRGPMVEWDARTGEEKASWTPSFRDTNLLFGVAFAPDGSRVVLGSIDHTAQVWDVATGKLAATLRGHDDAVFNVTFAPDGRRVATSSPDGTVRIWDVSANEPRLSFPAQPNGVFSLDWSPDGHRLVAGGEGGVARVWDPSTGREPFTLPDTTYPVAVSGDGRRVAAVTSTGVGVWDAATGGLVARVTAATPKAIALDLHGARIVVTTSAAEPGQGSAVYDVASGRRLFGLNGPNALAENVAWAADGSRILTGGVSSASQVWDGATGRPVATLPGSSRSVALGKDGSRAVTGSANQAATFWNATTGRSLLVLRGGSDQVFAVDLSRDGTEILTVTADGVATVWDTRTGQRIVSFHSEGKEFAGFDAGTFSPNGRSLAVGTGSGAVLVFDCQTCGGLSDLLTLAAHRVTRQLSTQERQRFLPSG